MVSKKILVITILATIALLGGALGVAWAQGPVAPERGYDRAGSSTEGALPKMAEMTPQAAAAARVARYTARLTEMVEKGWLTQEQADSLAAMMQRGQPRLMERDGAARGLQVAAEKPMRRDRPRGVWRGRAQ